MTDIAILCVTILELREIFPRPLFFTTLGPPSCGLLFLVLLVCITFQHAREFTHLLYLLAVIVWHLPLGQKKEGNILSVHECVSVKCSLNARLSEWWHEWMITLGSESRADSKVLTLATRLHRHPSARDRDRCRTCTVTEKPGCLKQLMNSAKLAALIYLPSD